jgi:hypothetical protein
MTQTYRTTDLIRWGVGKLSELTWAELDINFWDIKQDILALQALPPPAPGIDFFEVSGTSFYVHLTDDTTILGPYELPVAIFRARGEWTVATAYAVLDTFTINGSLYLVIFAHTSDPTIFDPGANDGLGNDYYSLMIETPGSSLPTGGATAQVLQKSSSSNYAVTWGWKFPSGGTIRQYLVQQSSTQDDAAWETPQADDIAFTPVTGSTLTSTNVADAIEEVSSAAAVVPALSELSDIAFTTGTPLLGSVLYYDGVSWLATEAPVSGFDPPLLAWDGSAWLSLAQTDLEIAYTQLTGSKTSLRDTTMTALGNTGTVSLDPSLGNIFTTTPSGALTINASAIAPGAEITVIINTSGTSSYNVTFGSNFKSQGVIATGVTTGKTFVVKFIGDSGLYGLLETSRTAAM